MNSEAIRNRCIGFVAELLDEKKETIDPNVEFEFLGLDSAIAVAMIFDLEGWLGIELSPSLLFEYPSINELAAHLENEVKLVSAHADKAAA